MKKMDLKNRIRVALGLDAETKLAVQEKLVDGTIIVSEADVLEVGADVSVLAEDGTTILLAPGDYELENGTTFVVETDGVIAEIEVVEEVEEETTEEEVEVEASAEEELNKEVLGKIKKVSKWTLNVEGDNFKVGDLVMQIYGSGEEEIKEPVNSGEYFLADGTAIQVDSDGKVILVTPGKGDEVNLEVEKQELSTDKIVKDVTDAFSDVIKDIKAELSEMRGYTETLETQNKELSDDLTKLSKEPAAEEINLNKHSKTEVKELSKRELSKLTAKERVRYNLERLKKK